MLLNPVSLARRTAGPFNASLLAQYPADAAHVANWGSATTPDYGINYTGTGNFTFNLAASPAGSIVIPPGNFLQIYVYCYGGPRIVRYSNQYGFANYTGYAPGNLVRPLPRLFRPCFVRVVLSFSFVGLLASC